VRAGRLEIDCVEDVEMGGIDGRDYAWKRARAVI
jgi:hypothetical protein